MGVSCINLSLRQDLLALPRPCDVALPEDGLTLLGSLPGDCSPLGFFDPQHRSTLNRLKYGNEGARQKGRYKLPGNEEINF